MSVYRTTRTRPYKDFVRTQCAYCREEIEYPTTDATEVKLECCLCGKRFIVNSTTSLSRTLPLVFPTEILSQIISLAAAYDEENGINPMFDKDIYANLLSFTFVSKNWNDCSNTILYGSIIRKWDSRCKLLIRTFDDRPDLCAHLRSFETYYPHLPGWAGTAAANWKDQEFERLQLERARGIPPHNTADNTQLKAQAAKNVMPQLLALAQERKAADWMDPGEGDFGAKGPEPLRREGGCAFVKFVARCPNLQTVTVHAFDFGRSNLGEGDEDEVEDYRRLEARLPLASTFATSVETLALTCPDWKLRRLFFNRTPNLQHLHLGWLDDSDPLTDSLPPFSNLRQLYIGPVGNHGAPAVVEMLSLCTPLLRHLTLSTSAPAVEELVIKNLPSSPLTSLNIIRAYLGSKNIWSPEIPPSLAAYLPNSDLHYVVLPYLTTISLLESLPTSLLSLETVWPSSRVATGPPPPPRQAGIRYVVESVVKASKSKLTRLVTFAPAGALAALEDEGTSETDISKAMGHARGAGIALILTRQVRFGM